MSNLRILLIADGRSPIAQNWMMMLQDLAYEVHLASTYPCEAIAGVKSQRIIPVGFSNFAGGQVSNRSSERKTHKKKVVAALRPLLLYARALLTPNMLGQAQASLLSYIDQVHPDIVHALRIPFEGMLASAIPDDIPLAVSIWGNDLTLHAKTTHAMNVRTRKALARADGLMADASRDIRLAAEMGLQGETPTCVVPGSGGLNLAALQQAGEGNGSIQKKYGIPEDAVLVVNPRGFRPGSVHQDTFFASIPLVLEKHPTVHFICPGMLGQAKAEKWLKQPGISGHVTLLPFLQQNELWEIYKQSQVYVSLSSHDGTPNSFLEAIACGCFPVVGDIASLREWVTPDENGKLVDPFSKTMAANAIIGALLDDNLRENAARKNVQMVSERADRETVSQMVRMFYGRLLRK